MRTSIGMAALLWPVLSWAQLVSTTEPSTWHKSTVLDYGYNFSGINLSYNSGEAIRGELLDEKLVRSLANAISLTDEDIATVRIFAEPKYKWINLYQLGKTGKAFDALSDTLREYVRARQDGHTKAFMMAAVSNRLMHSTTEDAGFRAIATFQSLIPISWLKKAETGSITNKAGQVASHTITTTYVNGKTVTNEVIHIPKAAEVCRWASYTLVDGEICWRYYVNFKADGSVDNVCDSRSDAKDVDPKYKALLQEIDKSAEHDMKKEGSFGKFGSCHRYWQLKKEKLKEKGIGWRSPAELSPNTCYD